MIEGNNRMADHTANGRGNKESGKKGNSTTLPLEHGAPNRCSLTGQTEAECGLLVSVGTVFVGPDAIRILNSQLADFERRQRGG